MIRSSTRPSSGGRGTAGPKTMTERACPACGSADIEVQEDDADFCLDCGEEVPDAPVAAGKYEHIVVGLVLSVDAIPKKKKLSKLTVDVGGDPDAPLVIVTNAKHMAEGARVVGSGGLQTIRIAEMLCFTTFYNVFHSVLVKCRNVQTIRISALRAPCRKYMICDSFLMESP